MRNKVIEQIAREHLNIQRLVAQHSDSKDFRELGVWAIRAALEAAYAAGRASAGDAELREMVTAFGTGSYGTRRQDRALRAARKKLGIKE